MKRFLLLMLLHGLTLLVVAAQGNNEGVIDSGTLLTSINGEQIGTETFTIRNESMGESSSVLTVNGQTVNIKTRTEYRDTHAAAFELEYGPSMKMKVSVNGAEVKMTGSQESTTQTDPQALFLENNVGYQYYFLVRRYDRQKGGVQQFKMFVPSIMQTLPVSLEWRDSLTSAPGKASEFEVYRAVIAGAINADIVTDTSGKIIFMAVPSQKVETVRGDYPRVKIQAIRLLLSLAPKKASVDYSAPADAPFTAEEVTINAKGFTLAGTLLLPKVAAGARPFPAVITITGSGQETRDEPVPIPGLEKYGIMRQVAETLAARGIAVLRVDDRGVGSSTGLETLQTATSRDFADDVRAEVAYLRSRPEIDAKRIALLGHSEGGNIAPMVAADDPQIAAIVIMAGSAKRGDQITIEQLNEMLERNTTMTAEEKNKQRAEQQEIINAVRTGGDLSKYPAQVRLPWIKEFWTYDPLPTIRRVRQPVLILHGALDRQVTVEQAGMLEQAARAAGNHDVTVRLFPNLNHLFLPAKTGAFSEYSTLSTSTVGEDVLKILGNWLETKLKAKGIIKNAKGRR
jgi:dipeptidyl aminopeptidase/acylaminoacyl peptidase